jgi:hypothetical protein
MNMIAPGVLRGKIIGRLDSMGTGGIWRETNLGLDRISHKRVIVDASKIEYCDGFGIGCFTGRPIGESRRTPDPAFPRVQDRVSTPDILRDAVGSDCSPH